MKRRDFIKRLPLLPMVLVGMITGRNAEAKEGVCKHEPLFRRWGGDYAWLTWCRDGLHGDDLSMDIEVCKHCGLLYGVDLAKLHVVLE